jgi:hypothetical protein
VEEGGAGSQGGGAAPWLTIAEDSM